MDQIFIETHLQPTFFASKRYSDMWLLESSPIDPEIFKKTVTLFQRNLRGQ